MHIIKNIPDLGYYFFPSERPDAPGFGGFAFNVYDDPTHRHFDPQEARLTVKERRGATPSNSGNLVADTKFTLVKIIITHPWKHSREYQVAPGKVTLSDRLGKHVGVYTYGGKLLINVHNKRTPCILESSMPIFRVEPENLTSIPGLLVEETEGLLARRRAVWHPDVQTYNDRLAHIDPSSFYASSIFTLKAQFDRLPHKMSPHIVDFTIFLKDEEERLRSERVVKGTPLLVDEIL